MKAPTSRTALQFDRRLRLEFHGATITSDTRLPARQQLNDTPVLTETATSYPQANRSGHKVLLHKRSVYGRPGRSADTKDQVNR